MYTEDVISTIDGNLFKEQRLALVRCAMYGIPMPMRVLDGLLELTDAIADSAYAIHGIDCMILDSEL